LQIEVLEAGANSDQWDDVLRGFPMDHQDIYPTAQYHQVCEANGEGKATGFLAREGTDLLFHPFLIRPICQVGNEAISGGWSDLETAYGYGGPLATTSDPGFLSEAWKTFSGWCQEQQVVAEFIRFNPYLNNHKYMNGSCQVRLDRATVSVRLDRTEQELWEDYPSGQRSKVRKALKDGLHCERIPLQQGLEHFKGLYRETMDILGADSYYYFSDDYFSQMTSVLSENVELFQVRSDQEIVAAGLFLIHGQRIHYHLGASKHDHRDSRPNNLLFHTVADWGREQGFTSMHLGGGNSPKSDDPLLRFKASISKNQCDFYLGSRIFDQKKYFDLCNQWLAQPVHNVRPNYFLLYRLP